MFVSSTVYARVYTIRLQAIQNNKSMLIIIHKVICVRYGCWNIYFHKYACYLIVWHIFDFHNLSFLVCWQSFMPFIHSQQVELNTFCILMLIECSAWELVIDEWSSAVAEAVSDGLEREFYLLNGGDKKRFATDEHLNSQIYSLCMPHLTALF